MKVPEHIDAVSEFQEAVAQMRECIETARQDLTPDEFRNFVAWFVELVSNEYEQLPVTDKITRRPVYERHLMRKHHMPLDPPSEAEKRDAIRLLRDAWEDEVAVEALRILDECGRAS